MNLLLPILAGVVGGVIQPLFKNITKNDYSFTSYMFTYALVGGIISLPLFLLNFHLPTDVISWVWLFITCILLLVGNLFIVRAFQIENISNIVIVGKVDLLIAFLAGLFLFSEALTVIKLLAACSIVAGIVIIFLEKKKLNYSRGLLLALLGGICLGFSAISTNFALKTFNPYFFQFPSYLLNVLILGFLPKTLMEAQEIFIRNKFKIILVEILSVASYILVLFSIKIAGLSVGYFAIDPVYTLVAVMIGIVVLKEREKILNKTIGTALIVLGLVGLA
jgi:drug/metabolite transporter (DMT)-like permease